MDPTDVVYDLGHYNVDGDDVHVLAVVNIRLHTEGIERGNVGRFVEDCMPRVVESLRQRLARFHWRVGHFIAPTPDDDD
jgi:hypothetical protein